MSLSGNSSSRRLKPPVANTEQCAKTNVGVELHLIVDVLQSNGADFPQSRTDTEQRLDVCTDQEVEIAVIMAAIGIAHEHQTPLRIRS
jgi:hypothetical protein